jgi:streptogramin lyase
MSRRGFASVLGAGRVAEAAEHIAEIARRQGDCRPLELVPLERDTSLQPDDSWYDDRAERLSRLMREHRHAIERVRSADAARSPAGVAGVEPERDGEGGGGGRGRSSRPGLSGRRLAFGGVVAAVAFAIAAVALSAGESEGEACPATMTKPSQADLAARQIPAPSPDSARPLAPVVVRSRPRSVAVGSDGVWVAQSTDGSVWLIDPQLGQPVGEPVPVGGKPFSIAVAEDVIWVTREDGRLVAIDRGTRTLRPEAYAYGAESGEVTLGAGSVWVNNYADRYTGMISRIDPCSGDVERIGVGARANTVKFAYGSVWVSDSVEQTLHRVDPATGRVTDILLPVGDPQDVGAGGGYVWPVSYGPKRVVRVDPSTNRVVGKPIEIGAGGAGAVVAGGALWIPNYEGDSVSRVDLATLDSEPRAARVGVSPTDIAAGFGRLWVPDNDSEPPTVTPIEP